MNPVITLTTDFGLRDSYVGMMKGVLIAICPSAHLIDITHAIPPQDIQAALLMLQTFPRYFPPDAVHLVVVDPGVGSERYPIAMTTPWGQFVGPDNGLLGGVWQAARQHSPQDTRAVVLDQQRFWRPQVSATFHGRDIFAPIAALLAGGLPLAAVGSPLDSPLVLPATGSTREGDTLHGTVIYIDHFGNCITTIAASDLAALAGDTPPTDANLVVECAGHTLPLCRTYADVAPGSALALVGSDERLEIAVCNANASRELGLVVGAALSVQRQA